MRYFSKTQYTVLTVLSMIGMSSAFAASNSANNEKEREREKKDCTYKYKCDATPERYTNFWVSGDLLVWSINEDGFSCEFGDTIVNTDIVNKKPTTAITEHDKDINFNWDLGFRVGTGVEVFCSGWETGVFWTHFNGKGHGRDRIQGTTDGVDRVNRADMWVHFNTIDAVFGRKLWIWSCVNLKPFAGLRYAHIKQGLQSDLITDVISATGQSEVYTTIRDKQRFWGFGPELGLEANFYIGKGWSLYGNLDGAILYGHSYTRFNDKDSFALADNICRATSATSINQWVLDAGLGIRWEFRYVTLQLGLEQHTYFDFNEIGCCGDLNLYGGNCSVAVHF